MHARTMRRALAVLAALAAVAGPAGAVRGAEPDSIGATVQTAVYLAEGRTLAVVNHSTIPVRFSVEPSAGVAAEPSELVLEPDAAGAFTITGEARSDGARLTVRVTQLTEPAAGSDLTALTFTARVLQARPVDYGGVIIGAAVVTLLTVGAVAVILARRRLGTVRA